MTQSEYRLKFHSILLTVVGILLISNIYVVKTLDIFGLPLLFAIAFLVEFVLLLFFIIEIYEVLRPAIKVFCSMMGSAWKGMQQNEHYIKTATRHPKFFQWVHARFSRRKPTGLLLTGGIAIAILFLFFFLGILQEVIFKETLIGIDQRILNLVPSIRTNEQTVFLTFITFLASWQSVVVATIVTTIILFHRKQTFTIILFFGTLLTSEGVAFILKNLVGRLRPEQALSLVDEKTFSFPSGHAMAATIIFGFLGYLIFKSFRHSYSRTLVFLGNVFVILLIGFSRIYLGAHYPSDVLASITFGCFLLSIFITLSEINDRHQIFPQPKIKNLKRLLIVPVIGFLFSLFFNQTFVKIREVAPPIRPQIPVTVDAESIKSWPKYSETLTGFSMSPISFIYIGSQQEIENIFTKNGWYKADPATLSNTLKAVYVGFRNEQYLNGPVTPTYYNARPENIAFQQPTTKSSFRERHHTRLWKTDYVTKEGREIWVATASFDDGIKLTPYYLPTHSIDPNIDAEREYIVKSLGFKNAKYLQVVHPQLGKNSADDEFFTDGRAVILEVPPVN